MSSRVSRTIQATNIAASPRPKMSRSKSHDTVSGQAELLADIEANVNVAAKLFPEMTQNLRHFAGRYLSDEVAYQALLGVVSARSGEGRTTVALGLASALSEMFDRVALVEMGACKEGSTLATELDLSMPIGLGEYIQDGLTLDDVLYETPSQKLWLLPAGTLLQKRGHLNATTQTRDLLAELRDSFDVVVVDLPPLLENEEAPALVRQFDGLIVVVNAGRTTKQEVQKTLGLVQPAPVRGVLLNKLEHRVPEWISSLISP